MSVSSILKELRETASDLINENHKHGKNLSSKLDELEAAIKKESAANPSYQMADKQFDNLLNEVMQSDDDDQKSLNNIEEIGKLSSLSAVSSLGSVADDKATVKNEANSQGAVCWLEVYYSIKQKTVQYAYNLLEKHKNEIDINDVCFECFESFEFFNVCIFLIIYLIL